MNTYSKIVERMAAEIAQDYNNQQELLTHARNFVKLVVNYFCQFSHQEGELYPEANAFQAPNLCCKLRICHSHQANQAEVDAGSLSCSCSGFDLGYAFPDG